MKSILQTDGIDVDAVDGGPVPKSPEQSKINTLTAQERKKALKQLASLISQFRSESGNQDELISFRLGELPNLLRFLAELATEAKGEDKNGREKKKILRIAAAILRRMLHVPDASYYRVLGLNAGATPEQIAEHYQLLHKLFWFDETIDPQRRSRLRIAEAYTVLKDSASRRRYDEELKDPERQSSHSVNYSRRRGLWPFVVAALLVISGLSGVYLYYGKDSETNIASLSEENARPEQSGQAEADGSSGDQPAVAVGTKARAGSSAVVQSESVREDVSTPIDYVAEQEKQIVPESPVVSAKLVQPDASSGAENKAINTQLDDGKTDSMPVAVSSRTDTSPEDSDRPKVVALDQKTSDPEPGKMSEEKHNILESASSSSAGKKHDVDVSLIKPPVVHFPDTSLVVPPRLDISEAEKPGLTTREKHPAEQPIASASKKPAAESVNNTQPFMVVIGSPGLSVNSLTREQVRAIFLGKKSRLPSGEQVSVLAPQGDSSLKTRFYRDILGKTPRQVKIHWAKVRFQGKLQPPKHLVDDEAVKEAVAYSPGMIGIIRNTAVDDSVKVLFGARL